MTWMQVRCIRVTRCRCWERRASPPTGGAEVQDLRQRLPEVCCVEMEGAAVAQVCDEYAIPFAVVRTISDSADENSVHDFPRFSREIARHYLIGALARYLAANR